MKAWVIGGTSGIGQATALRLCQTMAVSVTGEAVDVRRLSYLGKHVREYGPFDKVLFSAGINHLMWVDKLSPTLVENMFQVNVQGFLNVLHTLALVQPSQPCRIVAVSSDAAERPMRASSAYCASKAALNMVVRCAAREMALKYDWRINAVSPGMTDGTEMQRQLDQDIPIARGWTSEQALAYESAQNPLARRTLAVEVAEFICQVLDAPDYVNGSILTINGGR